MGFLLLMECNYCENGDKLKKFTTRSGMGFKLLRQTGIKPWIFTSENGKIFESRAVKLKVDYLYPTRDKGVNWLTRVKYAKMKIFLLEMSPILGMK